MTTSDAASGLRRDHTRLYDAGVMAAVLVAAVGAALASVAAPMIVAATAAVAFLVLLVLRRPDTATMILLVLLYSNAPVVAVRGHGMPAALSLAVPAVLLAPLAYHLLIRRAPLRLGIAGPILLALALAHLASVLGSADQSTSAAQAGAYVTNGLALYLLMVNVLRSEPLIRRAALALVATSAALGALAWGHVMLADYPGTRARGFTELVRGDLLAPVDWEQYFSLSYPDAELRAAGPIGEANFFAFILLLALPYAVAFLVKPGDRLERVVSLLALPFIAAGIVVSYSRGAAVVAATVAGLLALFGLLPRRTLVAIVGAGAALLVAVPDYATRILRLADAQMLLLGPSSDVGDAALTGRYSEMLSAGAAWVDHPILGLGPGLFPANYQRYATELGYDVHEGPREAHNLYLHYAAELGTVGLLLLLALLFVLLRHLLAVRRSAIDGAANAFTVAGIAVVGIIAANGMFLHLAFERYLWLHVAILAAWCAERRRTTRELEISDGARAERPALAGVTA